MHILLSLPQFCHTLTIIFHPLCLFVNALLYFLLQMVSELLSFEQIFFDELVNSDLGVGELQLVLLGFEKFADLVLHLKLERFRTLTVVNLFLEILGEQLSINFFHQ